MEALHELLAIAIMYGFLAAVLTVFGGIPYLLYLRSVRREMFALAARELHLDLGRHGAGLASRALSGEIDGFAVSIEEYDTGRFRNGVRVFVDGTGRRAGSVPASFGAAEMPRLHGPRPAVPEERVFTGAPAFDDLVRLGGDPPVALALLDQDTRLEIKRFLLRHAGARIEGGAVRIDLPKGSGGEALVELAREAVALAQRLVIEREAVPARLAHLARTDPLAPVRHRALEVLDGEFHGSREAVGALRASLGDGDEGVRGAAAVALGERLPEILREMLEQPKDAEAAAAAWALAALPGRFPAARVSPLARDAARDRRPAVRGAALRALAAIADQAAESEALAALASEERALARAAIEVLGAAGTAAAVPRLRELVERHPFDFAHRNAVEEAVARIRSRLHGAALGQVSLAGAEEAGGRVALAGADDGTGTMSLAGDGAAGEVSLAGGADGAGRRSAAEG